MACSKHDYMRNSCEILLGNAEGQRSLGRLGLTLLVNCLSEKLHAGAWAAFMWPSGRLLNTVMNLWIHCVRPEMALKIWIVFFWVITPCSVFDGDLIRSRLTGRTGIELLAFINRLSVK